MNDNNEDDSDDYDDVIVISSQSPAVSFEDDDCDFYHHGGSADVLCGDGDCRHGRSQMHQHHQNNCSNVNRRSSRWESILPDATASTASKGLGDSGSQRSISEQTNFKDGIDGVSMPDLLFEMLFQIDFLPYTHLTDGYDKNKKDEQSYGVLVPNCTMKMNGDSIVTTPRMANKTDRTIVIVRDILADCGALDMNPLDNLSGHAVDVESSISLDVSPYSIDTSTSPPTPPPQIIVLSSCTEDDLCWRDIVGCGIVVDNNHEADNGVATTLKMQEALAASIEKSNATPQIRSRRKRAFHRLKKSLGFGSGNLSVNGSDVSSWKSTPDRKKVSHVRSASLPSTESKQPKNDREERGYNQKLSLNDMDTMDYANEAKFSSEIIGSHEDEFLNEHVDTVKTARHSEISENNGHDIGKHATTLSIINNVISSTDQNKNLSYRMRICDLSDENKDIVKKSLRSTDSPASLPPSMGKEQDVMEKENFLDMNTLVGPSDYGWAIIHELSCIGLQYATRDDNPISWSPTSETEQFLNGLKKKCTTATNIMEHRNYIANRMEKDNSDTVLVWGGNVPHMGYGHDIPIVKARGIIVNATPRMVLDLLLDSQRVKEYNKLSMGRTDVLKLERLTSVTQERGDASSVATTSPYGEIKFVRSLTKIPLISQPLDLLSMIYARKISHDEHVEFHGTVPSTTSKNQAPENHTDSFLSISRAVTERDENVSLDSENGKRTLSEMLFSVNLMRSLDKESEDDLPRTEFTTVTHVSSPVPLFLAKRMGMKSITSFIQDLQTYFANQ